MTPFDAYKIYQGLYLHFTDENYDYFKYHGLTRVSEQSFDSNPSKRIFYKLTRLYGDNVTDYFLANFFYEKDVWIEKMVSPEFEKNYKTFLKRKQAIYNVFETDLATLEHLCDINNKTMMDLLIVPKNNIPQILKYTYNRTITLETFLILDIVFNLIERFKNKNEILNSDIWRDYFKRCKKYKPFLEKNINLTKYKLKIKNLFGTI